MPSILAVMSYMHYTFRGYRYVLLSGRFGYWLCYHHFDTSGVGRLVGGEQTELVVERGA